MNEIENLQKQIDELTDLIHQQQLEIDTLKCNETSREQSYNNLARYCDDIKAVLEETTGRLTKLTREVESNKR